MGSGWWRWGVGEIENLSGEEKGWEGGWRSQAGN